MTCIRDCSSFSLLCMRNDCRCLGGAANDGLLPHDQHLHHGKSSSRVNTTCMPTSRLAHDDGPHAPCQAVSPWAS